MWFEPVPQPDSLPVLHGTNFPVGFETPPGGNVGSPYHVLNDHSYCCAMDPRACHGGEPLPEHADSCLEWHHSKLGERSKDAKRLGIPLFITEFGACFSDGPCQQEIQQLADVADEHLIGWAYWQFKTYADLTTSAGTNSEGVYNVDGSLQEFKIKALARSFMQKTQGTPTKQKFDSTTGNFDFEFEVDTSLTAPSIGFFSTEYYYPNGLNYSLKSSNGSALSSSAYTADYKDNYLTFSVTDSALHRQTVSLSITPK